MTKGGALLADVAAILNMIADTQHGPGTVASCRLGKMLLAEYMEEFPEIRWCQECLSTLLFLLQVNIVREGVRRRSGGGQFFFSFFF
jgi:hypothetical protein